MISAVEAGYILVVLPVVNVPLPRKPDVNPAAEAKLAAVAPEAGAEVVIEDGVPDAVRDIKLDESVELVMEAVLADSAVLVELASVPDVKNGLTAGDGAGVEGGEERTCWELMPTG